MNELYIVDFDRTLFNNAEFFQDFSTVLASEFKINGKHLHELARRQDVVRAHATGIFSAFDAIRELHPEVDIEAVKTRTKDMMLGRSYTFVDVRDFIERLSVAGHKMKIITVGTDEYQQFKFEFASDELAIFDFIVTQETKGACLAKIRDSFSKYDRVTLIDDRADTFDEDFRELDIHGIRLNRVDSRYGHMPTPHGVTEYSSLLEVTV